MDNNKSAHMGQAVSWFLIVAGGQVFQWLHPQYTIQQAILNGLALSTGLLIIACSATGLWGVAQRAVTGRWPERYRGVFVAAILATFAAVDEVLYRLLGYK